jgi:predicted lipid-binding transport protein (Tim44 family)
VTSSITLVPSSSTATGNPGNSAQIPLPADANSQGQGTSGLSGAAPGLIAGAAVGGTLGFVALLVLGYLVVRMVLRMRQQAGYPPAQPGASQPVYRHHGYSQATTVVEPPGYGYPGRWAEPAEVITKHDHEPVELPAGR